MGITFKLSNNTIESYKGSQHWCLLQLHGIRGIFLKKLTIKKKISFIDKNLGLDLYRKCSYLKYSMVHLYLQYLHQLTFSRSNGPDSNIFHVFQMCVKLLIERIILYSFFTFFVLEISVSIEIQCLKRMAYHTGTGMVLGCDFHH